MRTQNLDASGFQRVFRGLDATERIGRSYIIPLATAMASMFSLPNELILSGLLTRFPCREQQIRSLGTLLAVSIWSCPTAHFTP